MSAAGTNLKSRGTAENSHPLGYVMLLAGITAISGFLFGFDTAIINGVLFFLRKQFVLSNFEIEIAASSILLGALLGAASASLSGDRYGRKKSLIFAALLFLVSPIAAATANSVITFSLARLIGGVAIGLASVLTPIYIAEISPAAQRGLLVSMNQLALVGGILVAYFASWAMSGMGDASWRWMVGVAAVPSLVFLLGLFAIPESPRWLISNGRKSEGKQILARIIGAEAMEAELVAAEREANSEKGSWKDVFSKDMRKRLAVGMTLALFSQITGVNTVLYYGSVIISEHFPGQSAGAALASNIIIGTVNVIFTIVAMLFLDRWGRRAILLTASGGMGVALTALVIGLGMHHAPPSLMLGSILVYIAFFAFGMGPGPWLIISEIFPTKVRGRASSIATSTLWSGALLVILTFLSLVNVLNLWGTFAIYGVLSFVCFLYVWKAVPETKGRTLEQIQEAWGKPGQ